MVDLDLLVTDYLFAVLKETFVGTAVVVDLLAAVE
jgi:hypothetical protein